MHRSVEVPGYGYCLLLLPGLWVVGCWLLVVVVVVGCWLLVLNGFGVVVGYITSVNMGHMSRAAISHGKWSGRCVVARDKEGSRGQREQRKTLEGKRTELTKEDSRLTEDTPRDAVINNSTSLTFKYFAYKFFQKWMANGNPISNHSKVIVIVIVMLAISSHCHIHCWNCSSILMESWFLKSGAVSSAFCLRNSQHFFHCWNVAWSWRSWRACEVVLCARMRLIQCLCHYRCHTDLRIAYRKPVENAIIWNISRVLPIWWRYTWFGTSKNKLHFQPPRTINNNPTMVGMNGSLGGTKKEQHITSTLYRSSYLISAVSYSYGVCAPVYYDGNETPVYYAHRPRGRWT